MYVNKSLTMTEEPFYPRNQHDDDDPIVMVEKVAFYVGIPICFLAILTNLLLIFVNLKYKALKLRCNHYILNYAICNIIYLISDYVLHFSMDIFYGGSLVIDWYCTLVQFENYFLSLSIIFIASYTFDEYILRESGEYFLYLYKNGYKYIIGIIYILHFIFAFIVSAVCFHGSRAIRFDVSFIIVTVIYVMLVLITLKIKYDMTKNHHLKDKQLRIAFKISVVALLLFLPIFLFYNILHIEEKNIKDHSLNIWHSFAFIPEYLAFSSSFVLAYTLFRFNKFYRLAFCKIFCKSRKDLDFSRLDIVPERDIRD